MICDGVPAASAICAEKKMAVIIVKIEKYIRIEFPLAIELPKYPRVDVDGMIYSYPIYLILSNRRFTRFRPIEFD